MPVTYEGRSGTIQSLLHMETTESDNIINIIFRAESNGVKTIQLKLSML